jgi:hypothetical protein
MQSFTFEDDTEYELSFYYKTLVPPPTPLVINPLTGLYPGIWVNPANEDFVGFISEGGVDGVLPDEFVYAEGVWLPASIPFRTPASSSSHNGYVYIQIQKSDIIIDDVRLVKTSGATDKQDQYIQNLPNSITKNAGDADFLLGGTTTSDLPISYSSSNEAVATISGSTVTITGAGATTITASQAGNHLWNLAPDVTVTLTVGNNAGIDEVKAPRSITFEKVLTVV